MTLRIEGHTDPVPMAPGQRSNWDLSVDRAVAVMAFFHRGGLFPLDRMAAAGYGETRPVAANTSEENRARNRRVDFVLRSDRPVSADGSSPTPLPF